MSSLCVLRRTSADVMLNILPQVSCYGELHIIYVNLITDTSGLFEIFKAKGFASLCLCFRIVTCTTYYSMSIIDEIT